MRLQFIVKLWIFATTITVIALLILAHGAQSALMRTDAPGTWKIQKAINSVFRGFGPRAMTIADCETGGTLSQRTTGSAGEVSVFQIHPIHWNRVWKLHRPKRHAYVTRAALINYPRLAAQVAFTLSRGGRHWYPWYRCAVANGIPL